MATPAREKSENETRESIERMRNFETTLLDRSDEFGTAVSLDATVRPAERLQQLWRKVSVEILPDVPQAVLNTLKQNADADYNVVKEVIDFDINAPAGNVAPAQRIEQLAAKLVQRYEASLNAIHAWISYSTHLVTDFDALEAKARATEQGIKDRADKLMDALGKKEETAQQVLETVRAAAAEQGVSQQAIFFRDEAVHHAKEADKWEKRALWAALLLATYVFATFFGHNLIWLDGADAFQLAISKFLGFALLSFLLGVATKNFLSHKHNAVVNKHRQNALATYKALVDAAGDTANRDVVLAQAAHCIFGPQSTGYARGGVPEAPATKAIMQMVSKAAPK